MAIQEKESLPRLLRTWLATNRHGKLASDQWMNLVTAPLMPLVLLAAPMLLLIVLTPLRAVLRVGYLLPLTRASYLLPLLLIGFVVMLVLRARRYARLPIYQGVFYPGREADSFGQRVRRRLTVYTEKGQPMMLTGFASALPRLEADRPYRLYYLEETGQYTLLSYAPLSHPDADLYEPSERFYERQAQRVRS